MTYLLTLIENTKLGALLLGIHENIKHGADGQGNTEIRGLAGLLHFRVKGSFGPRDGVSKQRTFYNMCQLRVHVLLVGYNFSPFNTGLHHVAGHELESLL